MLAQLWTWLLAASPLAVLASFALAFLAVLMALQQIRPDEPKPRDDSRKPWLRALGLSGWFLIPLFVVLFLATLLQIVTMWTAPPDEATDPLARRVHYLAIVGFIGVLGGILGALGAFIRIFTTERQTTAQEQGLITDRINKAVEALGAEKSVNRIGRPVTIYTGKPSKLTHLVELEDLEKFQLPPRSVEHRRFREPLLLDNNDVFEGMQIEIETWPRERTEIEWQCTRLQTSKSEQIGSVGTWAVFTQTQPNLEVRIGAIYALERIAQDSLRDHVQIMEILTAYIRENAKAEDAEQSPIARWWAAYAAAECDDDATKAAHADEQSGLTKQAALKETKGWADALPPPRTDIQAALTVIGRRSAEQKAQEADDTRQNEMGYRLDLRQTNLRRVHLSNLDVAKAMLDGAYLEGAELWGAHLEGANLWKAHLEGTGLWDAHLEWAMLLEAHLEEADLSGAHLKEANLSGGHLEGAKLCGAHLDQSTNFSGADTGLAALKSVDLTGVNLTPVQLAVMFGDGSVILPDDRRPPHWPSTDLDVTNFDAEWADYKSNPAAYIPPQDRPDPDHP
jgi:hypothetical protein